jgi:GH24 family phage-related lysozyme (muramidase)
VKSAVLEAFPKRFTEPLEGRVPSMYVDELGLVTIAAGCLIDPISAALPLRFTHADGALATRDEIAAAWRAVKADASRLSKLHWKYAAGLSDLRLDDEALDALVCSRMAIFEVELRKYFPQWDLFPADAQLCVMSMAWALGPGFPHTFGNFRDAANRQDWAAAGAACGVRTEGNPGIVPRNAQNRLCCANAAASVAQGLDTETLFWPGAAPDAHDRDLALQAEASAAVAAWADRERDEPPSAGTDAEASA